MYIQIHGSSILYDNPKFTQNNDLNVYQVARYKGTQYSLRYNDVDTSPEASAQDMFNQFKCQVSEIHPYDDAEYAWAKIENRKITIIQDRKVVDSILYFNADDADVDNPEWCEYVVDRAIQRLYEINKNIEPAIIHN